MPTNKTDRFSKIVKHTGELDGSELMVISRAGTPAKTHNALTVTFNQFLYGKVTGDDINSIVTFGSGISGTGKAESPLQIDADWLGTRFLRVPTNLSITSVGDRVTRYLPISRKKLFTHNYINVDTMSRQPPAINIEPTGELRVVARGNGESVTVSYGRWSVDKNLESEQLIERGLKNDAGIHIDAGTNMKRGYQILELFGTTATGTLALVRYPEQDWWDVVYFPLVNGSISERALGRGYFLAAAGSTLGQSILNGSASVFTNTAGTFLLTLGLTEGNAYAPLDIICHTVTLDDISGRATLTRREGWTINSYTGLLTAQPVIRLYDAFIGAASGKVALVNNGDHTAALGRPDGNLNTQFIHVLQDPNNINNTTLYFRGYAVLNRNSDGYRFKYQFDLVYKLTLTRTAASAVAVSNYLGSKPVLAANSAITNYRNTIVHFPNNLNPEYLKVLTDGSIVTGLVNPPGNGEPMRINPGTKGVIAYTSNNIHDNILKGLVSSVPQVMNFKPGYTDNITWTNYKLFIASPIRYMMANGGRGVIEPRVLDLSGLVGNPSQLQEIYDLPYVGKRYRGLKAWAVHLYIQHSGNTGLLLTSVSNIPEADNSTYIATIWFLEDGVNSILTQQAFSRLYKHRQSYQPRGMSVPVAYDNPGENPKRYWLKADTAGTGSRDQLATLLLTDAVGRFTVPPRTRARIWMVAGGGGGGGSVHNYNSSNPSAPRDGTAGGNTQLSLSSSFTANTITCSGGGAGIGANWGNGSSYSNGSPGDGGTVNYSVTDPRFNLTALINGNKPPIVSRFSRQPGGATALPQQMPYTIDGHGGLGAWGVGDEGWSYGGGGGSGAACTVHFTNTGDNMVTLHYRAGAKGIGRVLPTAVTAGNSGVDGAAGMIMVQLESL